MDLTLYGMLFGIALALFALGSIVCILIFLLLRFFGITLKGPYLSILVIIVSIVCMACLQYVAKKNGIEFKFLTGALVGAVLSLAYQFKYYREKRK